MPRDITVTFEDGTTHVYRGAPDSVTPDQVSERAAKEFGKGVSSLDGGKAPTLADQVKQQGANLIGGAIRGAGSIGATILAPVDIARDLAAGKGLTLQGNRDRRQAMDEGLRDLIGADPDSLLYRGGKLGAEVAGTLGAGGVAGNVLARAGASPALVEATRTAGMSAGGAGLPTRMLGGAVSGAASAGLVDPSEAVQGAGIGAALPPAVNAIGRVGSAVGSAARKLAPAASPEVAALADRAQQLGIPIPADRIINSKPVNALAASLEYVPFSGRGATVEAMHDGLNTALSKTFGQNSPNVNQALRQAATDLGGKFDAVLKSNTVKMSPGFKNALAEVETQANSELGAEASGIIRKQIADIQTKGAAGAIDGQTAYNIKKTLDRIGQRNTPEAFYARDLRRALMDALNDSLGPQAAAEFAGVRRQYGNMLALENLAQNGADGGVSAARLGNMKNINNADLQELADIAAQFMKSRESSHGSMQRVFLAGAGGAGVMGLGGIPAVVAGSVAGRGTNALLNSQAARNMALGRTNALAPLVSPSAQLAYRASPVVLADR